MAFQNIFTDGVLVDLDISKWTGERSLHPEDLGIKKEHLPKTFRLGQKALIPKEVILKFSHLDYLARRLLNDMSFPFAFGNARFVPKKRFEEFIDKLGEIKDRFYKEVDSLCDNYEKHKLEVRPEYVKAAHAAFSRYSKFNKDFKDNKDEFINSFLERVDNFYPPVEKIRSRYSMKFVVFQMAMPDLSQVGIEDVMSDNAKAELVKATYQEALYDKIQEYVGNLVNELRTKAHDVLKLLRDNIKGGKRITEASLNTIKNMVSDYEKMNIIEDNNFYNKIKSFQSKYVDPFSAKKVRADTDLQKQMLAELNVLVEAALNKNEIDLITDAYKNKIDL